MNSVLDLKAAGGDPLERVASVESVLSAAAARIDENCGLTDDVVEVMHDARIFRMLLPPALGGDALDLKTHAQVIEAIARIDGSAGWCASQGAGCAMASAFMDPAAAQRMFGQRDSVLAWGAGIQGKAVLVDGGYLVSGKWQFASGSRHATILGGHSWVFEADGETPRRHADGRRMDRTALVTKDKAHVHFNWDTMGLRGTGSDTFEFHELFVPEEDTVDRADQSALTDPSPIYKIPSSLVYAVGFAGLQIGIAQAVLDELADLAINKVPRGGASVLKDNPVFQTQLAQQHGRLRAARAYLHFTADEAYAEARNTGVLSMEGKINIRLAGTHVINEAVAVTTEGYRMAGATAIFPENPFERRLRDALSASQQVQARIDHYTTVGRHLLGHEPDSTMFI